MTRGTTVKSKLLPVTKSHLEHIIRGGSRAILNYVTSVGNLASLMGGVLNLQFTSNISIMNVNGRKIECGFSSVTYAKLNPMLAGLHLLPRQEEIDALNTGLSVPDWNRRYGFINNKTKDEDIFTLMVVATI